MQPAPSILATHHNAGDLLTSRARLTPGRTALIVLGDPDQPYTYAGLNQRANRMAHLLTAVWGVQPGDRVAILAQNHIAYIDLFFACLKIGAIFTPLNWRLTVHELTYITGDCAPRLLFYGAEYAAIAAELAQSTAIDGVVCIEDDPASGQPAGEPPRPQIDEHAPGCILYTSGTTGHPKGAVIPHRQILWNCINTVISWGLTEHDISPVLTPLFHSGGLFAFLTPLLYAGGRIILARKFEPDATLQAIQEHACTVVLGVPTLFQVWRDCPAFESADFSQVRFFINGGSAIPLPLLEEWRTRKGVIMRQGYGLTEVGVNCFSMTDNESVAKTGTVGKPIFHSQMRLLDPATGQEAATGQPGELLIKGPHVCLGYWNNPEATAQAIQEGWFHTGDMASRDAEGYYTILGRYKDMIKSGGENIYAAEVEGVFRQHPAVLDCALIGLPDEKWGETGLLLVSTRPGMVVPSVAELLDLAGAQLARFKLPKQIVFVDALPYSPYGKVEKARLRAEYAGK